MFIYGIYIKPFSHFNSYFSSDRIESNFAYIVSNVTVRST